MVSEFFFVDNPIWIKFSGSKMMYWTEQKNKLYHSKFQLNFIFFWNSYHARDFAFRNIWQKNEKNYIKQLIVNFRVSSLISTRKKCIFLWISSNIDKTEWLILTLMRSSWISSLDCLLDFFCSPLLMRSITKPIFDNDYLFISKHVSSASSSSKLACIFIFNNKKINMSSHI